MALTPGAKHFLAQRKTQGKIDVTDAQADALAALMSPVRVDAGAPRRIGASPRSAPVVGRAGGDFFPKDAA